MELQTLWEKLIPRKQNLETLKQDFEEGRVPFLPYFIINELKAKSKVKEKLSRIDGERFESNLIASEYGNGKTNFVKYLQLYFETYKEYNVDVIYSRMDVDQPDLILFLLKQIQDHSLDKLINSINFIKNGTIEIKKYANDFQDGFAAIREYSEKLFSVNNSPEDLKRIIYLGTGTLYTKKNFTNYGIHPISNYSRREILVLFLNILAESKNYNIFIIDEIEKVQEKSKLRFNQFLTSYRELIDLASTIKGHYLLTCFSNARASYVLQEANEALFTRISSSIIDLSVIEKNEDLKELIKYLSELFEKPLGNSDVASILTQLTKANSVRNRDLIRKTVELIKGLEPTSTLEEMLSSYGIQDQFENTKHILEIEDSLKSLTRYFFDPLEYYLEDNRLAEPEDISRISRSFYEKAGNTLQHFVFDEVIDIDIIQKRIQEAISRLNLKHILNLNVTLFLPERHDVSNSNLSFDDRSFKIIDYDPEKMFVLLNMYRENIDLRDTLKTVIGKYTLNNL
ncbi:hypothetical protein ACAW74_06410 [Fibrella sp. WM1]|uniref:hypothetical protein n=1 Tax=Fibrella musci TaxID=3242485 RepID=UPI00352011AB